LPPQNHINNPINHTVLIINIHSTEQIPLITPQSVPSPSAIISLHVILDPLQIVLDSHRYIAVIYSVDGVSDGTILPHSGCEFEGELLVLFLLEQSSPFELLQLFDALNIFGFEYFGGDLVEAGRPN
jgi:hypothetical protein